MAFSPTPLRRDLRKKWIGGVCAGLAKKTGWPVGPLRLLFAMVAAIPILPGLPTYLLMWWLVPVEPEPESAAVAAQSVQPPAQPDS